MIKYLKNNWLLLLILLLLTCLLFVKCENEKVLNSNIKAIGSKIDYYKLKNGQLVNSAKTIIYQKAPEQSLLTKEFKKVNNIIKVIEKIQIDTVKVFYRDSIPCDFDIKGNIVDKDYSVDYSSSNKGLSLYNLKVVDTIEIVTGVKRKWLLGKKTNTIDISHSNKLMTTDDIKHFEIVEKKKFYDTTLFKVAAGIIFGVVVIK